MSQSVGSGPQSSPGLAAPTVSHAASPSAVGSLGFDPLALPILVVDDEPDNLDAFRFSFRRSFNILTAQSGTEGLAILQREKIAVINQLLAQLDGERNVTFLDIGPTFLTPEGLITKDIMPDYLHPNEKGYRIWAEAIEPTVKKLMAE